MEAARETLLALIKAKAIVHGRVVLSSGQEADWYIDLRRITLDGEAAPLVGRVMLDLTADIGYDAVGGLTLGADPVATAMLHSAAATGRRLDAFVVRKAGKEHGLQRWQQVNPLVKMLPPQYNSMAMVLFLGAGPLVVLLYWMWRVRLRQNVRGLMTAKPI